MDFISADNTVSIHASVKDATIEIDDSYFRSRVSIHASVKDATITSIHCHTLQMFQSTHL